MQAPIAANSQDNALRLTAFQYIHLDSNVVGTLGRHSGDAPFHPPTTLEYLDSILQSSRPNRRLPRNDKHGSTLANRDLRSNRRRLFENPLDAHIVQQLVR
jgi:hypothetical protein